jgi:hypothetical protein
MSKTEPKIVCMDLETLPNLTEALKVWPGLGNYPGLTLKASINSIICFGYQEFGVDQRARCINAWDFPAWRKNVNDDYELLVRARELLADADGVITHNGKKFDMKFFNTRLLINGLEPLDKLKHIDTCQKAKQHLYLFNNRLNTLGEFLVNDKKLEHEGWPLWVRVHGGIPRIRDEAAEALMTKYCKKDVELTTSIFKTLRKFCTEIPNYNLYTKSEVTVCSNCGSTRLRRNGHVYTRVKAHKRWRCKDCYSVTMTNKKGAAGRAA